jgi:hypothetical protein
MRVEARTGPFLVTILDVSKSGLRLSSSTVLRPGDRVTVSYSGAVVTGEIRHIRYVRRDEYQIGVEADKVSGNGVSEGADMDLTRLFQNLRRS